MAQYLQYYKSIDIMRKLIFDHIIFKNVVEKANLYVLFYINILGYIFFLFPLGSKIIMKCGT